MIGRVLVCIVGLTLFGLACVWQNLQNRQLQYDITSVRKELREAHRRQTQLRVRLERLRSPARLRSLRERISLNFKSDEDRGRTLTLSEMQDLLKKRKRYTRLDDRTRRRTEAGQR